MKKSTIWLLIGVMALAVMGLLAVQIMYMENMIKMRNEQFKELVVRSLYGVSVMLEQNETKYYLDQDLQEAEAAYASSGKTTKKFDFDSESDIEKSSGVESLQMPRPANLSRLRDLSDSYSSKQEILKGQYLYQRGLLNEVILTILSQSSDRPITERADSATVNEYLASELKNNGVTLPYQFAVVSRNGGFVYSTDSYAPRKQRDVFSQVLFPNDPANKQYSLCVTFPTKSDYIFSSIRFLIPSFVFTIILLIVFVYTIVVTFKQKKVE